MTKILRIPRLNDTNVDFETLFGLWAEVKDEYFNKIVFDFSQCDFLRSNAVAFLGGLARLLVNQSNSVEFNWDTLRANVFMVLKQNGFAWSFDYPSPPWKGTSVPYREDNFEDTDSYAEYLKQMWLGQDRIEISPTTVNAMVGKITEIYKNTFDHGKSPIGLTTCGQYYPSMRELKLTLVDFGVGIPNKVRGFFQDGDIPIRNTMKWALEPGTTTTSEVGRGLGFDFLYKYFLLNGGSMEIFSHEGYAYISRDGKQFKSLTKYYHGTLVNITLLG